MILVDTCVLLDVVQGDPDWVDWSLTQLEYAAQRGGVVINPIVHAEFSAWYDDIRALESALAGFESIYKEVPRDALFLAGKAFRQYRARGGTRAGLLPDFFIAAHAAVEEIPVLTRDTARIRSYFPSVAVLSPRHSGQTTFSLLSTSVDWLIREPARRIHVFVKNAHHKNFRFAYAIEHVVMLNAQFSVAGENMAVIDSQ